MQIRNILILNVLRHIVLTAVQPRMIQDTVQDNVVIGIDRRIFVERVIQLTRPEGCLKFPSYRQLVEFPPPRT